MAGWVVGRTPFLTTRLSYQFYGIGVNGKLKSDRGCLTVNINQVSIINFIYDLYRGEEGLDLIAYKQLDTKDHHKLTIKLNRLLFQL